MYHCRYFLYQIYINLNNQNIKEWMNSVNKIYPQKFLSLGSDKTNKQGKPPVRILSEKMQTKNKNTIKSLLIFSLWLYGHICIFPSSVFSKKRNTWKENKQAWKWKWSWLEKFCVFEFTMWLIDLLFLVTGLIAIVIKCSTMQKYS